MDNKLKESLVKEELELLENYSETISTLNDKTINIDLYTFEKYIMPYVTGKVQKTEPNNLVFIRNYLHITKSPHISINVINENNEVIYKLPPLIMDMDFTDLREISFSKLFKIIDNYAKSNPFIANKLLVEGTQAISNRLKPSGDIELYIENLKKIIDDYRNGDKNEDKEESLFEY